MLVKFLKVRFADLDQSECGKDASRKSQQSTSQPFTGSLMALYETM